MQANNHRLKVNLPVHLPCHNNPNRKEDSKFHHHHLRSLPHLPSIVLADGMAIMSNSNAALISTAAPMVGS
jgi:hypothetical protein